MDEVIASMRCTKYCNLLGIVVVECCAAPEKAAAAPGLHRISDQK